MKSELPEYVVKAASSLRRPDILSKLWVLLRCHDLVASARRQRLLLTLSLLLVFVPLGILAGVSVYYSVYVDPLRQVWVNEDLSQGREYYVRGKRMPQAEYEHFLAIHNNKTEAILGALAGGIGVFAVLLLAWLAILARVPNQAQANLQEQIKAIQETHPREVLDAGGPTVLRQREMIEKLLGYLEKGLS